MIQDSPCAKSAREVVFVGLVVGVFEARFGSALNHVYIDYMCAVYIRIFFHHSCRSLNHKF